MTMTSPAADLAGRLAENAEWCAAVPLEWPSPRPLLDRRRCRQHPRAEPLCAPAWSTLRPGRRGPLDHAGTGEYGDLLDLIRLTRGHLTLREALEEARAFLNLPKPELAPRDPKPDPAPRTSSEAARRLFRAGKPVAGTLAAVYLAGAGPRLCRRLLGATLPSALLSRVSDAGPMLGNSRRCSPPSPISTARSRA